MLIAEVKRRSNVAEYILYMWQVEDMIRAYKFNIDLVEENIISQFNHGDKIKQEIRNWYANIIVMMHTEDIKNKGHLGFIKKIMNELNDIHTALLKSEHETQYHKIYTHAADNIKEFKKKLQDQSLNDIEICFNGLYGLLLLRLQKKEVSAATQQAMSTFSNLLAVLSLKYKQFAS
jgi:hypothetical protein